MRRISETHQLFRELGGEDGALGIATTKTAKVATLFEDVGVLHFCREGMHAEAFTRMACLFGKQDPAITAEKNGRSRTSNIDYLSPY